MSTAKKHYRITAAFAVCLLLSVTSAAHADVITTLDGARLVGTIEKITPKEVELKTAYAGVLTVTMDQVASLSSDAALTTQLTGSTTVTGVTVLDEQKTIHVTSETLTSTVAADQLQASWVPGVTPPPESLFDIRHWAYTVGADMTGKSGNSDERTAEQDNDETSDESIGGASYTAFMFDPWGWYVRGELEKDKFEDIDLRTTVATGLTWRPIHTDD
jgi:hypothetical protein